MSSKKFQTLLLVLLIGLAAVLIGNRQALQDWLRLRGYSPPQTVAQLAVDDTMTNKAQHLFYVNHPTITAGKPFTSHCPAGGEKTVVLGCYIGSDNGIFLYSVSDSRLQGVEQVTAAHEMLHAAYRRLSVSQRQSIDTMLTDYYQHSLTDQRIKDTIAAYQKSEPNDVVNEMHSVFGTEVADLPAPLAQYYQQYFKDRSRVTGFTAQYQAEFSSRQNLVKQYDAQLQTLKQQIDTDQSSLTQQKAALAVQRTRLQTERTNNQVAAYNSEVDSYNAAVNNYNALLGTTRGLINQYNDIVNKRNNVVLEEQELSQAISASPSTQ